MKQLTKQQSALVSFIRRCLEGRGYGPSIREISSEMGFRSPNGAQCHLNALEKKGIIRRQAGCARTIVLEADAEQKAKVRMCGEVKAGRPVLAEELEDVLDFSDLFGAGMFGLRVNGESMIDEGILPGDTVVARKTDEAEDGALVIARADGEQTLKRLSIKAGRVLLVPANARMQPWEPDELEIIGVVTGVVRRVA